MLRMLKRRSEAGESGPYQGEESLRLAEDLAERLEARERALALLHAAFAADIAEHDP